MTYFDKHVFFCTNKRDNNEAACEDCGASAVHAYAKNRIKDLGLSGQGKVRMNKAGCLDRCSEGPVLVVYPEGVWYTYVDTTDIDEIIDEHIIGGKIVDRLRLP
jgi:(2Fe-2S) ferredoxin